MKALGVEGQALARWFLEAVDRDTSAFEAVLTAVRLPKKTEEEQAARREAMERANLHAAEVPLEVLQRAVRALELALGAAERGNPQSVSDAGTAGACARAAAESAALNVRINAPNLGDAGAAGRLLARQEELLRRARDLSDQVAEAVDRVLDGAARRT